jgi:hypothetical protein
MALRGGDQAPGTGRGGLESACSFGTRSAAGTPRVVGLLKITPFREVLKENNSAKSKYFSKNTANSRIFEDFLHPQRAKLPLPEALRRAQ